MNTLALRQPPYDAAAEASVLGGLMLASHRIEEVAERLSESDFFASKNSAVYRAILHLSGKGSPIDPVTMADWFHDNGIDHADYVIELANTTPSAANILAYADIVRRKSVLRQLIDIATTAASDAYTGKDDGLVDATIGELMALQKSEARHEFTLKQAMTQAYKAAQEAKERGGAVVGIPSGIDRIDHLLGGWHNSDLIICGARPAMGKTAMLLNFAIASGVPCGIISAEQPAQQVGARVMSIESGVDALKLRNGNIEADELGQLANAVARLVEKPCMVYDRSAPTIANVTRVARKWRHTHGIEILFVDYVQRIDGTDRREKRHERVGEVVRGLKDIARDLDIPVVALCQVGRHVDKQADKRPQMGDMSDSSEIEKEADQILTLYRDEAYDENSPDKGIAEISVEKNRHGPTGLVRCAWIAPSMRFRNLAHGD